MSEENIDPQTFKDLTSNPVLVSMVEPDTELKNWLVEYTGNKMANDSPDVSVEMIAHVVAEEFPEFMIAIAEENFFRGYEQALTDINEFRSQEDEAK